MKLWNILKGGFYLFVVPLLIFVYIFYSCLAVGGFIAMGGGMSDLVFFLIYLVGLVTFIIIAIFYAKYLRNREPPFSTISIWIFFLLGPIIYISYFITTINQIEHQFQLEQELEQQRRSYLYDNLSSVIQFYDDPKFALNVDETKSEYKYYYFDTSIPVEFNTDINLYDIETLLRFRISNTQGPRFMGNIPYVPGCNNFSGLLTRIHQADGSNYSNHDDKGDFYQPGEYILVVSFRYSGMDCGLDNFRLLLGKSFEVRNNDENINTSDYAQYQLVKSYPISVIEGL